MKKQALLIFLLVLGGATALRYRDIKARTPAPSNLPSSPQQAASEPSDPALASLEPAEDLPKGALQAHGNKDSPVLLRIYVPSPTILSYSPLLTPYQNTLSMVAQMQKEYPQQVRLEVYALDDPDSQEQMKADHIQLPTVVLLLRNQKENQELRREVFKMVGEETHYHVHQVEDAIREALQKDPP